MFRKTAPCGAGIILFLLVVATAIPNGESPKKVPTDEIELKGKIVALFTKGPAKSTMLGNLRIKRLGDRSFIGGTYATFVDGDEMPTEIYWFPVDGIDYIIEYKSLEEARRAYQKKAAEK